MKLQDAKHTCGAVALCNALEAANIESPTVEAMMKLAGTTPIKGTSTKGICKALKSLSIKHETIKTKVRMAAGGILVMSVSNGEPVILSVDNGEHWVVAVGLLGRNVLVVDSALGAVVQSLPLEKLLDRWLCDDYYEGVVVGKRESSNDF